MKNLGEKIKDLRYERKWTLRELSEKSGASIHYIWKIENGKRPGTAKIHQQVADAFGMKLVDLYGETTSPPPKTLKWETKRTIKDVGTNSAAKYQLLSNRIFSNTLVPILIELKPKQRTTPEKSFQQGEGIVYVLEGSLKVSFKNEKHMLKKDQSCFFDTSIDYTFENMGEKAVKFLYITAKVG